MSIRIEKLPGHSWGIRSHYSPRFNAIAKEIPGIRPIPEAGWIRVGYADAIATLATACEAEGLPVVGEVTDPEPPSNMPIADSDLRNYQRFGVRWLLAHANEGCVLADDLGLGKTAQSLRTARTYGKPTLIVVPNHLRGVWGDGETSQVKRWWPAAWPPRMLSGVKNTGPWRVFLNDEQNAVRDLFDTHAAAEDYVAKRRLKKTTIQAAPLPDTHLVTVAHYDILHAWAPHLTGAFYTVIFDEAQYMSNERARRTQAARAVRVTIPNAIALTGTPMTNRPKDLYALVDVVSPGRFGEKSFSYLKRYCDFHYEQVGKGEEIKQVPKYDGVSNPEELQARLSHFMLRRTKLDVKMQLPPRTRNMIDLEIPAKYRMRPIGAAANGHIDKRLFRRMLDSVADAKLEQVIEAIKANALSAEHQVVFCHRRAIAEAIAESCVADGIEALFSHGEISQKERDKRIAARPRVLAVTIDTTATGLDFSFASHASFAELTWEWWKLVQCEGRLHRFGQENPVTIDYYIAAGSVDSYIRKGLLTKLDSFEKIIGEQTDAIAQDLAVREEDVLRKLTAAIMKDMAR